jgi:hypothetical protein
MKLITLIIFLTVSATSYGLSCVTTEEPLLESLDGFDDDAFMANLKELPTNADDNDDICRVELVLNYAKQSLTVKFTEHINYEPSLDDGKIQLDTLVERSTTNTGDFTVINFLEHACSEDGCEKEFITNHINLLRKSDFIELKKKIGPLLIGNGNKTGEYFFIINKKRRVFFSETYINSFGIFFHHRICALRVFMKEKLIRMSF